jgi:hypothetical protein
MTKIGTFCWIFDINRRVYNKDEKGFSHGSPIYREHWIKLKIIDETTRSWITSDGTKLSKMNPPNGVVFSEEELNDIVFIHDHAYKISEKVRVLDDVKLLKEIATLAGYTHK